MAGIGTPGSGSASHAQQWLPRLPGRTTEQPTCGQTQPGTWPRPGTERVKRLRTDKSARLTEDTARENKPTQERERAQGPSKNWHSGSKESGRAASANKPEFAERCKFLIGNLVSDKVTFARNGFAERAQNSQRVTPHDRGVGNVLAEEGGEGDFGLVSGLRAVGTSLLSVRGADRDVKGSVGVAQGRDEDNPRVASPTAQQVAWAAPMSRDPFCRDEGFKRHIPV